MTTKPNIEFENDRVRVTRVQRSRAGSLGVASRSDRLIVYLRDTEIKRKEAGREERLQRHAGEVVWRGRSQHEVEVMKGGHHEVLIIELKP